MLFKVIYSIIHSKTCQLLGEIVLYILNTPGKLLEKAQKKSWKTPDLLSYESVLPLTVMAGAHKDRLPHD